MGKRLPSPLRKFAGMFLHYILKGHIFRTRLTKRFLEATSVRKLQIGCGRNLLSGWLNSDIVRGDIYLDATRKMPFKDNTFDFVFCEHFIEHLSINDGLRFLRECYRILRTRGIIRITTPDLEKLIKLYFGTNDSVKTQELAKIIYRQQASLTPCEMFNNYMHKWGHEFIYDKQFLGSILLKSGFTNLAFCRNRESKHESLRNLEGHEGCELVNLAEAVTIEAEKC